MSIISNIKAFLLRVPLEGKEVPAFNECYDYLTNLENNGNNRELKNNIFKDKKEEYQDGPHYPGK